MFFLHAPDFLRILSSPPCSTARLLTLCILLLSLAPLGSIYVLLFSLGIFGLVTEDEPETLSSYSLHGTAPNMTLDEFWSMVFDVPGKDIKTAIVLNIVPVGQQHMTAHLKVVLPWALSFFLGVIIPTVFSLWSFLRNRRLLMERKRRREKNFKKISRLLIEEYSKRLTSADLITNKVTSEMERHSETCRCSSTVLEMEGSTWQLPVAGSSITSSNLQLRQIDGACAICLHSFQLDDTVSWSSNLRCMHSFHQQCIVEWLSRKRNRKISCPCCRQPFIVLPTCDERGVQKMATGQ